jgi:hypothetical protein
MDEARVGHGKAAEKQAAILTPLKVDSKNKKAAAAAFLLKPNPALSWRGA